MANGSGRRTGGSAWRNGSRNGAALFVLIREDDRTATDIRCIGHFTGTTGEELPDVMRHVLLRSPSFVHLDLRDVRAIDDEGLQQLTHIARICRRHGAMVKVTASAAVEERAEAGGLMAVLGLVPRHARDLIPAGDGSSSNSSARATPRY